MITRARWLLTCVVSLFAIMLLYYLLFWRYITVFDAKGLYQNNQFTPSQQVKFFKEQIIPQLDLNASQEQESVLVFHWLDIDCKCSFLGKPFIEKITTMGKKQKVKHIILTKPTQQAEVVQSFNFKGDVIVLSLSETIYQLSRTFIPASPGASIYYPQAKSLSYFGPHSSGVTCGQGSNYIELVLNNLSYGFDPKLYELSSEGCFCQW